MARSCPHKGFSDSIFPTTTGKLRAWLFALSEYMLFAITERRVVNGVHYGMNMDDYMRQTYGLEKETFQHQLFQDEFASSRLTVLFKWLYKKLRPVYYEHFLSDLRDVLSKAIEVGHIKESHRPEGTFVKEDLEYSRKVLSFLYYPRKLLEYEPLRDLLAKVLRIAIIAFLGWTGISALVHIL